MQSHSLMRKNKYWEVQIIHVNTIFWPLALGTIHPTPAHSAVDRLGSSIDSQARLLLLLHPTSRRSSSALGFDLCFPFYIHHCHLLSRDAFALFPVVFFLIICKDPIFSISGESVKGSKGEKDNSCTQRWLNYTTCEKYLEKIHIV